ncbi:hypothetical protein [Bradyrhizobium sp. SZCCHNS3053]|uniref:hypothetical protein n=1 Tax=Bradyrhizobium sp. SZCCHNS3053 TaxID=3057322 RepID=UPI0029164543|nr:hypothetical protein [Bradyrhizobium sp. SZCCHNS3053]
MTSETADDHFPCHSCGTPTHIDDLDGRPEPHNQPDPDGKTDWTRLECGACYGPGYVSNRKQQ